jgi:hypothetical protein
MTGALIFVRSTKGRHLFRILAGSPGSKRRVHLVSAESGDKYVRKFAEQ